MTDLLTGCSDGACVVRKPTGMHTNGGKCYCVPREPEDVTREALRQIRATMRAMRHRVAELEAQQKMLLDAAETLLDPEKWGRWDYDEMEDRADALRRVLEEIKGKEQA